jgi:hypothetical protein
MTAAFEVRDERRGGDRPADEELYARLVTPRGAAEYLRRRALSLGASISARAGSPGRRSSLTSNESVPVRVPARAMTGLRADPSYPDRSRRATSAEGVVGREVARERGAAGRDGGERPALLTRQPEQAVRPSYDLPTAAPNAGRALRVSVTGGRGPHFEIRNEPRGVDGHARRGGRTRPSSSDWRLRSALARVCEASAAGTGTEPCRGSFLTFGGVLVSTGSTAAQGAGRGRGPLVNPSPRHNSRIPSVGSVAARRPTWPRSWVGPAVTSSGNRTAGHREAGLARSPRGPQTDATPVVPAPHRILDASSILAASTTSRLAVVSGRVAWEGGAPGRLSLIGGSRVA